MIAPPVRIGDRVWFRPECLGYGYFYGVDKGVPAIVEAMSATRVRIRFYPKDATADVVRWVSQSNLEPRT